MQNSRLIGAVGYEPLPFRTGYEQVIAHRTDSMFSIKAIADGVVTAVTADTITVEYKNGDKAVYELGTKHGTASGTTIPHTLVSDVKVGQKVKKDDILAWNTAFFERDLLNPRSVAYKAGKVAKVALLESADTIEDGSAISSKLAETLAVPSTTLRTILVDFDQSVLNLVEVGQEVVPDDILCTLEDAVSADISEANLDAVKTLTRLTAANLKAKGSGKIAKVEVLYFGEISEMSESLQTLVLNDNKRRANRARRLKDGSPTTGQVNESMHVGGKKLMEGMVAIKIYIDGSTSMGSGDKLVFANQLKSTCSRVMVDPITTDDGETIDAFFGYKSVANRIVLSPELSGTMNVVVKKWSSEMARIYKEG